MYRRYKFFLLPAGLILIVLLVLGLMLSEQVQAQTGGQGRFKTIEVQVTQYVWEIVSKSNGIAVCEVLLDREGTPSVQDAINTCSDRLSLPLMAAGASTPGPSAATAVPSVNYGQFSNYYNWRFKTKREFTQTVKVPLPEMVLNISVPQGPVEKPYVTVSAYEPVVEYKIAAIQGKINQSDFSCAGSACDLFLTQESLIVFRATSTFGDQSTEVQANVQIVKRPDGYVLTLSSLSPFTLFTDSCASLWGVSTGATQKWAEFPQLPSQLSTNKTLHFLTSRLIFTGIVNAKDCPGGGFLSPSVPNSCGLERAKDATIQWQNQYDPVIWSAARKLGIPPKIIKTTIEKESQFWPGNARNFIEEFGLAQMNEIGADVALRWNNDLFKQACYGVLANCNIPYASLPTWQQAMVRGNLMRFINAECPGCVNGFDQTTTNQSVEVMANVLKANCSQIAFIMKENFAKSSYEDMWKFTMASYHSGYQCVYDAIDSTFRAGENINWNNVSLRMNCPGGKEYVDDFWTSLTTFESNLMPVAQIQRTPVAPTYLPTRTPIPTPIPVLSKNLIRVFVYIEVAGKAFPDDIRMAEDVIVLVSVPDGSRSYKTVTNGQAIFDMSIYPVGTEVTVSLPGLFRSYTTRLTNEGEILVPFRLKQPVLPPSLP